MRNIHACDDIQGRAGQGRAGQGRAGQGRAEWCKSISRDPFHASYLRVKKDQNEDQVNACRHSPLAWSSALQRMLNGRSRTQKGVAHQWAVPTSH